MAEQRACVRCNRPIDAYARSCVYCGWDQATPPPLEAASPAAPLYVPPADNRLRNRIIATVAFIVLVISAFVLGAHVRSLNEAKATQAATQAAANVPERSAPRSTVTLVPVEGSEPVQQETPVTSAPAQPLSESNDTSGERADATALPSGAYSAAAKRATAERAANVNHDTIDPRTIGGSGESHSSRTTHNAEPTVHHTRPVPLYQPVPTIVVDRPTSARLTLTVGSDGRVQDINVAQSIPGEMPRLIAAVQSWRYRPATLNGQPVTSTLSVDINVRP
ncbi:MAG TPA: energy transducer TonB [Thermoanaerobaculia bacterium]|nr:energy transducer TonB [Thermoanaerobaculia bacterium]